MRIFEFMFLVTSSLANLMQRRPSIFPPRKHASDVDEVRVKTSPSIPSSTNHRCDVPITFRSSRFLDDCHHLITCTLLCFLIQLSITLLIDFEECGAGLQTLSESAIIEFLLLLLVLQPVLGERDRILHRLVFVLHSSLIESFSIY